jgi:thiol-disulfide isomerase/thioredoxin
MSRVKWHILAGGAAVSAPLLWFLSWGLRSAVCVFPGELPRAIETVPDLALADLDWKVWRLSDFAGRPLVLNFWSTWCGPCKIERPVLQRGPQDHPDVAFLGVLYSDDPVAARRLALPYPTLVDPDGRLALDLEVRGVSETLFVDGEGRIVHRHIRPLDRDTLAACIDLARGVSEARAACEQSGPR